MQPPSITVQIDLTIVRQEDIPAIEVVAKSVIAKFFPSAEIEFKPDYNPFYVSLSDPWEDYGEDYEAEETPAIVLLEAVMLQCLDLSLSYHGISTYTTPRAEAWPMLNMFYDNTSAEWDGPEDDVVIENDFDDEQSPQPASEAEHGRYMYNAIDPLQLIQHDDKMVWTATPQLLERYRRIGYVTPVGVVYYEEYAVGGAMFMIIREPGMTDAMMEEAARWLREKRDVVGSIIEAGVIGETASGVMDLHLPTDTIR